MKLWLDDLRLAPEGWIRVKTAREAIERLRAGDIDVLSLDHDLGDEPGAGTGYEVSVWLENEAVEGHWDVVPNEINTHSANPVGAGNILAAIAAIGRMRKKR